MAISYKILIFITVSETIVRTYWMTHVLPSTGPLGVPISIYCHLLAQWKLLYYSTVIYWPTGSTYITVLSSTHQLGVLWSAPVPPYGITLEMCTLDTQFVVDPIYTLLPPGLSLLYYLRDVYPGYTNCCRF